MSISSQLTDALMTSVTVDGVIASIKAETPRYSGYTIESVKFDGSKMTIRGCRYDDNGHERLTSPTILLETDLNTCKDIYGRKNYLGFTTVDIELIRAVVLP